MIWTQIVLARFLPQDHRFIHCFRYRVSWKEFTDRAVQANDKELVAKINIVEKYTNIVEKQTNLPGYIKILEEQAQYSIVDPR